MTYESCLAVDANVGTWGKCLMDVAFFGDPALMAIALLAAYGFIMWRLNIPGELALPFGMLLLWGMQIITPEPAIFVLALAATVIALGYVGISFANRFARE